MPLSLGIPSTDVSIMLTPLSNELLGLVGSWGRSPYPLGTTVAIMVAGLLVVLLIRRLTIGDWFGWWRTYLTRVIMGFCVAFGLLMKPPLVVAIAIMAVITFLWYYLPWRYRRDT